ncbi:hypothetical protein CTAYLR_001954 [Chrysophaeum taylorii]|uniref:6,7-dimethyl-8-ribityllumazine synthase n=1 Tax=Chrysophaeum taylorii TaxID=2483200 RepID=A0AAD7XJ21_9STRA|nr:hypothetical protein CTAYLR_001954 [Chrysophaeum taylorii]
MLRRGIVALALAAWSAQGFSTVRRSVRMDAGAVNSVSFEELDGSKVRIGIIKTRWNPKVVDSLSEAAKTTLGDLGVKKENIFETKVPGSWELPSAARFLALSGTVDSIICLGCLIKGETMHFEYIADTVSSGLMSVQLSTSVPCTFGVLTCNTEQQAAQRSYSGENHGISWAKTAVEMALLRQEALGMTKKGTMNLGFGEDDDAAAKKNIGDPQRKIFF